MPLSGLINPEMGVMVYFSLLGSSPLSHVVCSPGFSFLEVTVGPSSKPPQPHFSHLFSLPVILLTRTLHGWPQVFLWAQLRCLILRPCNLADHLTHSVSRLLNDTYHTCLLYFFAALSVVSLVCSWFVSLPSPATGM